MAEKTASPDQSSVRLIVARQEPDGGDLQSKQDSGAERNDGCTLLEALRDSGGQYGKPEE